MREYSDIERMKSSKSLQTVPKETLPPGYFRGFRLSLSENQLSVGKGICEIRGTRVVQKTSWILDWGRFVGSAIVTGMTYYIYLNRSLQYLIDVTASVWDENGFGYYHPVLYDYRFVGQFDYSTQKLYTNVVNGDPIGAGDLDADTAKVALLQAGRYAIIGYSGNGTNESPIEGDRRVYIDDDEIGLEEYTGGSWSTVKGIKIGGATAGIFMSLIAACGLYNPNATAPTGEYLPSPLCKLYNFENNKEDQNGTDDWDSFSNNAYSTTQKKFGSYSLTGTTGNVGFLYRPAGSTFSNDQASGAWLYVYNTDGGATVATDTGACLEYYTANGHAYLTIALTKSANTNNYRMRISACTDNGETVQYSAWSTECAISTWYYVSLRYDASEKTAYMTVNNEKISLAITGTWDADNVFFGVGFANGYNLYGGGTVTHTSYLDEVVYSYDELFTSEIFIQHYTHNVAWSTTYSALDLLFKAATNGYLQFISNAIFSGTAHFDGDCEFDAAANFDGAVDFDSTVDFAGATITGLTTVPTGSIVPYAGTTIPSGYLFCDGTTQSRTTYATLFAAITKVLGPGTATDASDLITITAHGLKTGDPLVLTDFTGSGTGWTKNTVQYWAIWQSADTFKIASSLANAIAGTAVTFSGGNLTDVDVLYTPFLNDTATGSGITNFYLPDLRGVFPRGAALSNSEPNSAYHTGNSMQDAGGTGYGANAYGDLGAENTDQMQGHKHTVNRATASTGATLLQQCSNNTPATETSSTPVTDGTNGTPRTGVETRPAFISIGYIIKT